MSDDKDRRVENGPDPLKEQAERGGCGPPQAQAGDMLYASHHGEVDAVIRHAGIQGADAQDVAQEVWLEVAWALEKEERGGWPVRNWAAWLIQVALQKAWALFRYRRRHPADASVESSGRERERAGREEEPGLRLERQEEYDKVKAVLADLCGGRDGADFRILEMLLVEGLSAAQVAERLGLTPAQVSRCRWRALRKLRKKLGLEPGEGR